MWRAMAAFAPRLPLGGSWTLQVGLPDFAEKNGVVYVDFVARVHVNMSCLWHLMLVCMICESDSSLPQSS